MFRNKSEVNKVMIVPYFLEREVKETATIQYRRNLPKAVNPKERMFKRVNWAWYEPLEELDPQL